MRFTFRARRQHSCHMTHMSRAGPDIRKDRIELLLRAIRSSVNSCASPVMPKAGACAAIAVSQKIMRTVSTDSGSADEVWQLQPFPGQWACHSRSRFRQLLRSGAMAASVGAASAVDTAARKRAEQAASLVRHRTSARQLHRGLG